MSEADAIARKLDFMRADIEEPGSSPAARLIAGHATLLLGAVDAVLALANSLDGSTRTGPPSSALEEDRVWVRQECADLIREVTILALTGKEAGDGG